MADTEQSTDISATPEWAEVAQHHAAVAPRHLRELFADDPGRVEALTTTGADLSWTTPRTASPATPSRC